MRLGNLNSAIRNHKGAITVQGVINGKHFSFALMKTPLLDELKKNFPGGRTEETGLALNADGVLVREGGAALLIETCPDSAIPEVQAQIDARPAPDDDDDDLGLGLGLGENQSPDDDDLADLF